MLKPILYEGGISFDKRGSVSYNNNLIFKKIKRFYIVQNKKNNFVRAWHGHKIETKYILCIKGKVKVSAVRIKDFKKPKKPYLLLPIVDLEKTEKTKKTEKTESTFRS